ncbi:MAG: D-alanine--D-alanine ligase [Microthrixaceae bacterium]
METGRGAERGGARALVVFGGRSAEHEVSVASGWAVAHGLSDAGYELVVAHIARDGTWRASGGEPDWSNPPNPLAWPTANPWSLLTQPEGAPDVLMAVLHGPPGEDGVIVALAQLAGVAYVGSGLLGSALCMDKTLTREVLDARGLAQTPWLGLHPGDAVPSLADVVERLGATVFVKPANLGSSIGISRVADPAAWEDALEQAFGYDDTVIVEAEVEGREVSVSVLGNRSEGFLVSETSETTPNHRFLDYADKYGRGAAMAHVPAPVTPELSERVKAHGRKVARALRVDGLARVDLFLVGADSGGTSTLLVNEVNTMPGFTAESTFPRMWAASGVQFPELVDRLCALALRRHGQRSVRTDPIGAATSNDATPPGPHALTIRAATEDHWVRIGELTVAAYSRVPGRPHLPDYDRELADTATRAQRLTLVVAENGRGEVVGTLGYYFVPGTNGRVGRARQIAVDPTAQGLGVGRALLEWAMARLQADGASEMLQRTAEYMQAAQALYRAAGFVRAPEWDEVQDDGPTLLGFHRYL